MALFFLTENIFDVGDVDRSIINLQSLSFLYKTT